MTNPCVTCHYARMRRDICGIYCTGGFAHNGKCEHYENWKERRKQKRHERTVQKQSVHGQTAVC